MKKKYSFLYQLIQEILSNINKYPITKRYKDILKVFYVYLYLLSNKCTIEFITGNFNRPYIRTVRDWIQEEVKFEKNLELVVYDFINEQDIDYKKGQLDEYQIKFE